MYTILLIPGDGIGLEVIPAAEKLLRATGLPLELSRADAGWDTFQKVGRSVPDETLEQLLATYDEVAAATDELVRTVDLAERQPLPAAPWFEPGATWAHRRTFWHVVAETAQHAGHADIIRETIDGQKSMG